ncbi:MAG: M14 family metallopeptidase, partial [Planctomycetota bacterium]
MTLLLPLFLQTVVATAGPMQAPSPKRTEHHHLVTIRIKDARTLERVVAMDLDLAACADLELPVKLLEVIADDEDLRRLKSSGLDHEIVIRNLEDSIEKRLSRYVFPRTLTPPLGQGAMGGHYTWAQVIAILDSFSKANPKICSAKASIGKSHQGRDLWMVKISDNVNVDENEPEVLFDAMHHAREPLSMETTLLFMDWLIDNYGKDSEATYLVDHRELYFVPVVNPDGYEYNRSIRSGGGGMWRKNRRVNNASSFGVDLNRNYPTGWSAPFGGNSTNPLSNVYRGPKPLSEPEALALDNFAKSRSFTLGCSAHTYGDILLRPWGYQRADPANLAQYRIVDAAATKQNGIRSGAASKILYIAAGTALDHYHAGHGMISYTPELGRSSEGGFWPNPTRTVSIARRHQHMFRTLARYAGGVISVASASLSEAPGGNNNGKVDPGETAWVTLSIGNRGAGLPTSAVLAS